MNNIKSIKYFTSVIVLVITLGFHSLGWGSLPRNFNDLLKKYSSKSECKKMIATECTEACKTESNRVSGENKTIEPESDCSNYCIKHSVDQCDTLSSLDDDAVKEELADCRKASEEFDKVNSEAQKVCKSTSSDSSDKSCKDKISSCTERMKEVKDGSGNDKAYATLLDSASNLLQQTEGITVNLSQLGDTNGNQVQSCTSYKNKDSKQSKKDFDQERKSIQDEIKKTKDDILKAKKDYNDAQVKIKKAQSELEKTYKETKAKIAKELQQQIAAANKKNIEAGANIKKRLREIDNEETVVRQRMYQYTQYLKQQSEEKINLNCKEMFATAKMCLVGAIKGQTTSKSCEGFPTTVNKKGQAASSELKEKLNYIYKSCYENKQLELANKKNEIDEANLVSQKKIDDIKNAISDEYKAQQVAAQELTNLQTNATKEEQQALEDYQNQVTNYNTELQAAAEEYQSKQQKLAQEVQAAENKLSELKVKELTGDESAVSYASETYQEAETKFNKAYSQCGCAKNASDAYKPIKTICESLEKEKSTYQESSSARSAPKGKNSSIDVKSKK